MTVIFRIRNGFVLLGLGAALVLEIGCNADQSASKIESHGPPPTRPLEGLEKDLKPPVIIKPNLPPESGTEQLTDPKRDATSSEHAVDLERFVSADGLDRGQFADT